MSDEKLRELERAVQESGSEQAELAWLRERARAGEKLDWESYSRLSELDVEAAAGYLRWRVQAEELSKDRLALATYCGHNRAEAADPEALGLEWARGLAEWGVLPLALASAAGVSIWLGLLEVEDSEHVPKAIAFCDQLLSWLRYPSQHVLPRLRSEALALSATSANAQTAIEFLFHVTYSVRTDAGVPGVRPQERQKVFQHAAATALLRAAREAGEGVWAHAADSVAQASLTSWAGISRSAVY